MRSLLETIVQFQRLERIEIGGTKGDMLSASVIHLYGLFMEEVKVFSTITYDCFNINDNSFDHDFDKFAKWISESEIQIGSVVAQGLADCVSVEAAFKLLSSFEADRAPLTTLPLAVAQLCHSSMCRTTCSPCRTAAYAAHAA